VDDQQDPQKGLGLLIFVMVLGLLVVGLYFVMNGHFGR